MIIMRESISSCEEICYTMPMVISLYIHKILYKFGGTESFTAKFLEIMQELYPQADIVLITECFASDDKLSPVQMAVRLNDAYGTEVRTEHFSVRYIATKKPKAGGMLRRLCRKCCTIAFQRKLCEITAGDDLFVNCSNQAVRACARRNITIIHFPQDRSEHTGISMKLPFLRPIVSRNDRKYLACYEYFLPNSQFTAGWLKQKWGITDDNIKVFYHPAKFVTVQREKILTQIAVCGRIEASKKIDVMVRAFNSSDYLKSKCVLKIAGSCDNEDEDYINAVRSFATEHIQIMLSPSRAELEALYAESGIFWHAKGYGETNPMLMEHFGMTTIEAMSAGCIPVVINKGGQKEIVTAECGYVWDEPDQLVTYTEQLLRLPATQVARMRAACIARSRMCSKESFKEAIQEILG